MFRKGTAEVRTTKTPSLHDVRDHFYVDGTFHGLLAVLKLTGTVKILPLAHGGWSLRSIGPKGNATTVHASGHTKVVADGIVTTVESHYWRIQNNAN